MCCGQGLQKFSTFVTKGRAVLTLLYAECLENMSMEMRGTVRQAAAGGVVQETTNMSAARQAMGQATQQRK